jgi:hypothetical protein
MRLRGSSWVRMRSWGCDDHLWLTRSDEVYTVSSGSSWCLFSVALNFLFSSLVAAQLSKVTIYFILSAYMFPIRIYH